MGEATNGVEPPRKEAENLEREIEDIRGELDDIVGELDRRRHELLDWRLQLRRHKARLALVAGGLAALVGGLVALRVWRHRERDRPLAKLRRLRQAVSRMVDDPDSVARPTPSVGRRILAATGGAVTGALGKRLMRG